LRNKTRKQRYNEKMKNADSFPISITTINFHCDENLGYIIRSAACFGAECVNVIGCIPDRRELRKLSGSLLDYVELRQFKNPEDFLKDCREQGIKLVSAELTSTADNLEDYDFDLNRRTSVIVGNETTGVPQQLIVNSDPVYIEMPGVGYCLNTAQAANIMLYEAVRQFKKQKNFCDSFNRHRETMIA
jgi:tRNA G18 (ribose-2'-O)-methylase SpoU